MSHQKTPKKSNKKSEINDKHESVALWNTDSYVEHQRLIAELDFESRRQEMKLTFMGKLAPVIVAIIAVVGNHCL